MTKLGREQAISLAVLAVALLACGLAPLWFLKARSDALRDVADAQAMLTRLEAAQGRAGGKDGRAMSGTAPDKAFLNAQTPGLAGAQLEAYLSQLVLAQQANLISSGVQQTGRADTPEVVRVQATLEVSYEALQGLLYKLEMGTPYVFVDSMTVQSATHLETRPDAHASAMKVALTLHAIWRRMPA